MLAPEATPSFVHDWPASRVLFGPGRLDEVHHEVQSLGARALIINDRAAQEPADKLGAALGSVAVERITEVAMHVPTEVVADAALRVACAEADVLVCVGGGSATGLAKALARDLELPIVAVPTTYAGSEMTSIWGITEDGRKTTGRSGSVRPRTVVYDPALTTGLPVPISITSGVNALAHAVEALYSPTTSPLGALIAVEAVRAMSGALPAIVEDPLSLEARSSALRGAWLCGWALEVSTMGLHHKLCHILGGLLDLPHSPLHTVLLPHVISYCAPAAPSTTARLAEALGEVGDAADAGGLLRDRNVSLGAPSSLAEIGMERGDLDRCVDVAASTLSAAPVGPRNPDRGELAALLTAAWSGDRPHQV